MTANIFEGNLTGLPYLFFAFCAFRSVVASAEEVWKKWPASFERDMMTRRRIAGRGEDSIVFYDRFHVCEQFAMLEVKRIGATL